MKNRLLENVCREINNLFYPIVLVCLNVILLECISIGYLVFCSV